MIITALKNFVIFLCVITLLFIHTGFAFEIPYEKCEERKKEWTDEAVALADQFNLYQSESDTEAQDCSDCSENMPQQGAYQKVQELKSTVHKVGDIPPVCFFAGTLRGVDSKKNYNCEHRDSEFPNRFKGPRKKKTRPCLNKSYIDMTAKAFNKTADCFGFSPKEKQQMFALFNHESKFMLNSRSSTKARCYGQMTMPLIEDINKNIYYRNRGAFFGDIYKNAIKNCPGLKDKVTPTSIINQKKRSDKRFKKLLKPAPITCNMTHDPYTCLFYSMFNVKINQEYFDNRYSDTPNYMGRREPSPQMEKDFLFPIQLNEMLVVKGTVTIGGQDKQVEWVFWDTSEAYDTLRRVKYNAQNLEIKKSAVFDKDTLRSAFTHYAHNGGNSVVKTHLTTFIENTKQQIASGKYCSNNTKCQKRRGAILSGEALSVSDLQSLFSSYVRRNRIRFENPGEVSEFSSKIIRDINFIHDLELKAPNAYSSFGLSPAFQKEVSNKCPKVKDIYPSSKKSAI